MIANFFIVIAIIGLIIDVAILFFIKKGNRVAAKNYRLVVTLMSTSWKYVAFYSFCWLFSIILSTLFGELTLASLWIIGLLLNLVILDETKKLMRVEETAAV